MYVVGLWVFFFFFKLILVKLESEICKECRDGCNAPAHTSAVQRRCCHLQVGAAHRVGRHVPDGQVPATCRPRVKVWAVTLLGSPAKPGHLSPGPWKTEGC